MSKRILILAGAALALSAAFNVPRQLERHHHASHYVSVQVFAAVFTVVVFAVIFFLVFFAVAVLIERYKAHDSSRGHPA